MIIAVFAISAVIAAWLVARWVGPSKPCPTYIAALFDNALAQRFSGVQTVVKRADIRSGIRVLDAGCGPGRLTIALARRVGERGEVVALDIQQAMLDRVRRNAARAGVNNVRTLNGALERDAAVLRNASDSR